MTSGQQRAIRELQRLAAASPNGIEIVSEPLERNGAVRVKFSIQIGPVESRPGGLELREREEFNLSIPADFPFDYPRLSVEHDRFAGFAHVIWSHGICLYRHLSDWNPRGSMYGFFEQLRQWLARRRKRDGSDRCAIGAATSCHGVFAASVCDTSKCASCAGDRVDRFRAD